MKKNYTRHMMKTQNLEDENKKAINKNELPKSKRVNISVDPLYLLTH